MPMASNGLNCQVWNEYENAYRKDAASGKDVVTCDRVTRRFELVAPMDELWYEVAQPPRERFVVYEAKDLEWLTWAGLVTVRRFMLSHGCRFNLMRLGGVNENGIVDWMRFVDAAGSFGQLSTLVRVRGIIPESLDLGGFYVR